MLTAFPSDSYVEPSLSSGDHLYRDVAEVDAVGLRSPLAGTARWQDAVTYRDL